MWECAVVMRPREPLFRTRSRTSEGPPDSCSKLATRGLVTVAKLPLHQAPSGAPMPAKLDGWTPTKYAFEVSGCLYVCLVHRATVHRKGPEEMGNCNSMLDGCTRQ